MESFNDDTLKLIRSPSFLSDKANLIVQAYLELSLAQRLAIKKYQRWIE